MYYNGAVKEGFCLLPLHAVKLRRLALEKNNSNLLFPACLKFLSSSFLSLQNKLFGNLGLGASCSIQLDYNPPQGSTSLKTITLTDRKGDLQTIPIFTNKDTLSGIVKISPTPGKRVEHQSIRVQLVGEIELASERGHPHEFLSLVRDLSPPGEIISQQTYPFEFKSVEMEYESYKGTQVRLRYMLRVTVIRGLGQTSIKEFPFWVRNPIPVQDIPPMGEPIKMEVGIEDCLHIEFEYDKQK